MWQSKGTAVFMIFNARSTGSSVFVCKPYNFSIENLTGLRVFN